MATGGGGSSTIANEQYFVMATRDGSSDAVRTESEEITPDAFSSLESCFDVSCWKRQRRRGRGSSSTAGKQHDFAIATDGGNSEAVATAKRQRETPAVLPDSKRTDLTAQI